MKTTRISVSIQAVQETVFLELVKNVKTETTVRLLNLGTNFGYKKNKASARLEFTLNVLS